MNIKLTLNPELPWEKLYELHYYKAIELIKAFKKRGQEPRVFFFHPKINSGELRKIRHQNKEIHYLQTIDGKISPNTFQGYNPGSTEVQGLEEAARIIRGCVYTRWRLWSQSDREYFIEHFLLDRPPNFLLKDSPITALDIDENILQYIRIHKFYRLYRQWPTEIRALVQTHDFYRLIDDSVYLSWRNRILYYNHLGPTYDYDCVEVPEIETPPPAWSEENEPR
ncbi:hypothetical protein QAD02_003748 [Eretmocerus hayati]|uniref:Uncharacterized protein n=1 Tax=Eretmocerus hayati TaxID=131215 RepID=A0ACC2NMK5_9HYME|nr:hypothetical protein QAD02_003748 [Eretmocerus hayati]